MLDMRRLFILLMMLNGFAYSQTATINYELQINHKTALFPINYLVIFKDNKSLECPLKINQSKEIVVDNIDTEIRFINSERVPFIFKDLNKKNLIYSESFISSKSNFIDSEITTLDYLVKDTLDNFNWIISKEHKKIKDFDCIKAISKFRGRDYEAWFTKSINIPIGPWKFGGLPGLIIAVNDLEMKYNYILTDINLDAKINLTDIRIPKTYIRNNKINYNKFLQLYNINKNELNQIAKAIYPTKSGDLNILISLPERIEKY